MARSAVLFGAVMALCLCAFGSAAFQCGSRYYGPSSTSCSFTLNAGDSLTASTCAYAALVSYGSIGDTTLSLTGPAYGYNYASNDDAGGSCGLFSYLTYTATASGTYTLTGACYANGGCTGNITANIVRVNAPDPCASRTNCASCMTAAAGGACGWCSSTGTCKSGTSSGSTMGATCPASSWFHPSKASPYSKCADIACAPQTDCASCTGQSGCGWCASNGKCGAGNETSAPAGCASRAAYVIAGDGQYCPAATWTYCNYYSDCGTCQSAGCGWCSSTNTCSSGNSYGSLTSSCPSGWLGTYGACPASQCGTKSSCSSCAGTSGCGWCASTQTCKSGSTYSSTDGTCSYSSWTYGASYFCPSPPTSTCSSQYSCSSCQSVSGCGWCASTGTCSAGTAAGSSSLYCPSSWLYGGQSCYVPPSSTCSSQTNCGTCTSTTTNDGPCQWCDGSQSCVPYWQAYNGASCSSQWKYTSSMCYTSVSSHGGGLSGTGSPTSAYGVSNKGWIVPSALAAAVLIVTIVLFITYSSCACGCQCCACCTPTPAQRALPSLCNSKCGPFHVHVLLVTILWPISAVLLITSLLFDGFSVGKNSSDYFAGAWSFHGTPDGGSYSSVSYADFCDVSGRNALSNSCPSLRASGILSFAYTVLALLVFAFGFIRFCAGSPKCGRKPDTPLSVARIASLYAALTVAAVLQWALGAQLALDYVFTYYNNERYFSLGLSWALTTAAAGLSFPIAIVLNREAVRGPTPGPKPVVMVVPGVPVGAAVTGAPAAIQMSTLEGAASPYVVRASAPARSVRAVPLYPALPIHGAEGTAYVPAPPVLRVPVASPSGLVLPAGSILYSNGDVSDAAGNLIGIVPGMRRA